MNWKFWKRKEKDKENKQMVYLQEGLTDIQAQMESISDQVTKLTRTQVKSSKNIEEKMDEYGTALSTLNEQKDLIHRYERQQEIFIKQMIRLLDEFDHVSSGMKEKEEGWQTILDAWSRTIVESLEGLGVYQLDVIGKTFNPEVAESLKTVEKDALSTAPFAPYQVIEVLQRGYINENGKLIRKAQVITVKEEDTDVQGNN